MSSLETVYRDEKIQVPKEVQKRLGLIDGDRLLIQVVDEDKAILGFCEVLVQGKTFLTYSKTLQTSER